MNSIVLAGKWWMSMSIVNKELFLNNFQYFLLKDDLQNVKIIRKVEIIPKVRLLKNSFVFKVGV